MPYYKIAITLKTGRIQQGIRLLEVWNPDTALRMVEKMAKDHYGEGRIRKIDVAMLPKSSEDVKQFLARQGKK